MPVGGIQTWDDVSIQSINPSIRMPSKPIVNVVRGDEAAETYEFTSALSKLSSTWSRDFGTFDSPQFVGGVCCKSQTWKKQAGNQTYYFGVGQTGMTGVVQSIPYTIGYATLASDDLPVTQYAQVSQEELLAKIAKS